MEKKLFIKTFGCQMNVYDSDRMIELLAPLGYRMVAAAKDADLAILNTCHIREKAAEKLFSDLGRIRGMQKAKAAVGERMLIAVGGCVGQAEGAQIFSRAPFVDIVFGPQTYGRLPEMIARCETEGRTLVDVDFPVEDKFDTLPKNRSLARISAFLTVQEGCDKFCTFCVVPYTRGKESSRSVEELVTEAQQLVSVGAREITLLGQNVNAYHGINSNGKEASLGHLIRVLADIPGLDRIRFTTSHPTDVDTDLISAFRDVPKLMPLFHLPVQSGSDRILRAMNRSYTSDTYRRLINQLRKVRPDIAFSSDFIVGFPGETREDFEATLELVQDVQYAQSYAFKYSPRPGTPAAFKTDQIVEEEKRTRLKELQAVLSNQHLKFNRACIGEKLEVLFDRAGRKASSLLGRSQYMQVVRVSCPDRYIGDLAKVVITSAGPNQLDGKISHKQQLQQTVGTISPIYGVNPS